MGDLVLVSLGFLFFGAVAYSLFGSNHPGRVLADWFAVLLCIFGVLLIVVGFFGAALLPLPLAGFGGLLFWFGTAALVVGILISRTASRKKCPQCAESVKLAALKCKHCGAELAMTALLLLMMAFPAYARDPKQVRIFRAANPCPSTKQTTGACPGFFVDHIIPLALYGPDRPDNMQWLSIEDGKKKDRLQWEAVKAKRAAVRAD